MPFLNVKKSDYIRGILVIINFSSIYPDLTYILSINCYDFRFNDKIY